MRCNIVIGLVVILVSSLYGDQYRDYLNKGQKLYGSEDYQASAEQFRQAEVLKPDDPLATFNYGTALYKSQDYGKAANKFSQSAATAEKMLKNDSYYDLGNSLYRNQDYAGAMQAYKNTLMNNPGNVNAKYNLELARMHLEQQQQKQQQQKKEDKEQEQQQEQENQQQQQQDQQQQQQNQLQQQKPQPKKGEMTEQEAKELLEAFKEDEKQIQKGLKKFKIRAGQGRDW